MTPTIKQRQEALELARADAVAAYTSYRTEGHTRRVRLVADTRKAQLLAQEPLQEALSPQNRVHIEEGHRVVRYRDEEACMREELIEKMMNLAVCGSSIPTAKMAPDLLVSPYVPFIRFDDYETEAGKSLILDRLTVDSEVALCELVGLQPLDLLDHNIGFRIAITHPLAKYAGCTFVEHVNGKTHTCETIEQLVKVAMQAKLPNRWMLTPIKDGHAYAPFCVQDYIPTREDAKKIPWECLFYDHEVCLYESNHLLSFCPNSPIDPDKPLPRPLHTLPIRCSLLTTYWAKKPLREETLIQLFTPEGQKQLLVRLKGAPLFKEFQNLDATIACLNERWTAARAYLAACRDFAELEPTKERYLKLFRDASTAISSSKRLELQQYIETHTVMELYELLRPYMVPTFLSITCVMYPLLADMITLSYKTITNEASVGGVNLSVETILYRYLKAYAPNHYDERLIAIRSAIVNCSIEQSAISLLYQLYLAMRKSNIALPHTAEIDNIFDHLKARKSAYWYATADKVCDPDTLLDVN